MVKKIIGKRIGAIALAAVLAATAFPADMSLKILADEQTQETNYFVDGDLGDDSTDDLMFGILIILLGMLLIK